MKKLSLIAIVGSLVVLIGCGGSNPTPGYNIPPNIGEPNIKDKINNTSKYHIPSGLKKTKASELAKKPDNKKYSRVPIPNKIPKF